MTDDELKRVVRIMDHGLAGALPTCRSGRELAISLIISFCVVAAVFGVLRRALEDDRGELIG